MVPEWLGPAADWASVVGFVITCISLGISIYVAKRVHQLRREIVFAARADEIIGEIDELASSIRRQLEGYPATQRQVDSDMRQVLGLVTRIRLTMSSDERRAVARLQRASKSYQRLRSRGLDATEARRNLLWVFSEELTLLVALMHHSVKDRRVGGGNGP